MSPCPHCGHEPSVCTCGEIVTNEARRRTLERENHEMWNAIETALGHLREPLTLQDARWARDRLTAAYNALQVSRVRAALAQEGV